MSGPWCCSVPSGGRRHQVQDWTGPWERGLGHGGVGPLLNQQPMGRPPQEALVIWTERPLPGAPVAWLAPQFRLLCTWQVMSVPEGLACWFPGGPAWTPV